MGIISDSLDRVILNPAPAIQFVGLPERAPADVRPAPRGWAEIEADDLPGPGWQDDAYEPTLEEEAELRGYGVGVEDGRPSSPTDWPDSARIAYARGRQRGRRDMMEREAREEADYADWLRELAEEREAELMLEERALWHESEVARCQSRRDAR